MHFIVTTCLYFLSFCLHVPSVSGVSGHHFSKEERREKKEKRKKKKEVPAKERSHQVRLW